MKKLQLHKETLRPLGQDAQELRGIAGGMAQLSNVCGTGCVCPTGNTCGIYCVPSLDCQI